MAEMVAGIHTTLLQLTKIDQGMYVIKTHFTLQCIILLALFCFYVVNSLYAHTILTILFSFFYYPIDLSFLRNVFFVVFNYRY